MSTTAYGSITVTDLLDIATYIYYSHYSAAATTADAQNWHTVPITGDKYIGIYTGAPMNNGQPAHPIDFITQLVVSQYVGDDAEWFFGTTVPSNIINATVGSMYLNTTTSDIYKLTSIDNNIQTWTLAGNIADGTIKDCILDMYPIYYAQSASQNTISGNIVSFDDVDVDNAINEMIVDINVVQSGSGDPSPTNIRPISGWNSVELVRCGVNVFGGTTMMDKVYTTLSNATKDDTNVTVSFSGTGNNAKVLFNTFKPSTRYTFILTLSHTLTTTGTNLICKYTDGTLSYIDKATNTNKQTIVFVSTAGKSVATLQIINAGGTTTLFCNECGIFEGVLTATDFEEYQGTTYPINLPQTVYGGKLDVVSGELTVTWGINTYDGSEDWHVSGEHKYYYLQTDNTLLPIKWATNCKAISNEFAYKGTGTNGVFMDNYNNAFGLYVNPAVGVNTRWIFITYDDLNKDLDAFKSFLTNNPLVIAYEINTPTTITLTPTEVTTLLGDNNIWADCGDINITYMAIPQTPNPPEEEDAPTLTNDTEYGHWTLSIPKYNNLYPYYYSCYEYLMGDESYRWSNVLFDSTVKQQAIANQKLDERIVSTTTLYYVTGLIYQEALANVSTIATFNNIDDEQSIEHIYITIPKATQFNNGTPSPGPINQWDEQWEVGALDIETGKSIAQADCIRSKNFIKVIPEKVYYFNIPQQICVCYYNENKEYETYANIAVNSPTITIPATYRYIKFYTTGNTYGERYINNISINYPNIQENEMPIIGTNSVDLNITGVNVWDEQWEIGKLTDTGGLDNTVTNCIRTVNYIPIKSATQYRAVNSQTLSVRYYNKNKEYISRLDVLPGQEFTTPANAYYMKFFVASNYGIEYNNDISINYPSTKTAYYKYSKHSSSNNIDFNRTYYGGDWDVISGEYTKTYEYLEFDGSGDEEWRIEGEGTNLQKFIIPLALPADSNLQVGASDKFSNRFVYSSSSAENQTWGNMKIDINAVFYDSDQVFSSTETDSSSALYKFKDWLRQHPVQICYKLANTQTLHFNPTELKNPIGYNNIWTNSGNLKIIYLDTPLSPELPTEHVENINTNYNEWTTSIPKYDVNYPYYYQCQEYLLGNGNYNWDGLKLNESITHLIKNFRRQSNRLGYIYLTTGAQIHEENDYFSRLYADNYKTLEGIKQVTSELHQTADKITMNFDNFVEDVYGAFEFSAEGLNIKQKSKNDTTGKIDVGSVYSHIGAETYQFRTNSTNTPVFSIDVDGTAGKRADVTGQLGIGAGEVASKLTQEEISQGKHPYTEQWAIRKGANQNTDGSWPPSYDLQIVWIGGGISIT